MNKMDYFDFSHLLRYDKYHVLQLFRASWSVGESGEGVDIYGFESLYVDLSDMKK